MVEHAKREDGGVLAFGGGCPRMRVSVQFSPGRDDTSCSDFEARITKSAKEAEERCARAGIADLNSSNSIYNGTSYHGTSSTTLARLDDMRKAAGAFTVGAFTVGAFTVSAPAAFAWHKVYAPWAMWMACGPIGPYRLGKVNWSYFACGAELRSRNFCRILAARPDMCIMMAYQAPGLSRISCQI